MNKEQLIELIMDYFNGLNNALAWASNMLFEDPASAYPVMSTTIDSIFNVILGVSYVLITLFFIIDFTGKAIMLEVQNYQVIAKLFLRLLIAKIIVENCRGIMYAIFFSFQDVMSRLSDGGTNFIGSEVAASIVQHIQTMDGGWFGFYYIMYYISLMPSLLIVWGVSFIGAVVVIARLFEIMIYSAVAPLPLATLAGETTTDTTKRFLQNYIAVCLQGLIIVIAFRIFGSMIADKYTGNTDLMTFLVLCIVFALTLIRSGAWSKQIVGIM